MADTYDRMFQIHLFPLGGNKQDCIKVTFYYRVEPKVNIFLIFASRMCCKAHLAPFCQLVTSTAVKED